MRYIVVRSENGKYRGYFSEEPFFFDQEINETFVQEFEVPNKGDMRVLTALIEFESENDYVGSTPLEEFLSQIFNAGRVLGTDKET